MKREGIMRYFVFAGLMLLIALAPGMSRAQEDAPWPPDPEAIFAEGVEVVAVELIEYSSFRPGIGPYADNSSRRVLTPDQWMQGYPYPEGVEHIDYVYERSDGTYIVVLDDPSESPSSQTARASASLILHPSTGEYTNAEAVCGDMIRALPGEERWRFYTSNNNNDVYLCFTGTGETEGPLPNDLVGGDGQNWLIAHPSAGPDGRWIALLGNSSPDDDSYQLFSYSVATNSVTPPGSIELVGLNRNVGIGNWVSNNQGAIYDNPEEWYLPSKYYSFDVTHPDSVEFMFWGWPIYDDDLMRYEDVDTDFRMRRNTGTVPNEYIPCTLNTYDATGVHHYVFGFYCIPIPTDIEDCRDALRFDGDYFFLRIDSDSDTYSTLVYFDVEYRQATELLEGEIERILGISPSGRFIALVIDDDEQLELADVCGTQWYGMEDARLAVFDRETGTIVYETENFGTRSNDLMWVADNEFVFYMDGIIRSLPVEAERCCIVVTGFGSSVRLVTVRPGENAFARTVYWVGRGRPLVLSPDERYLITGSSYYNYTLIDFHSGNIIPITRDEKPDYDDIRISWNETGELVARVSEQRDEAVYTIRLPQPESQ
jgi:hypothetical protein